MHPAFNVKFMIYHIQGHRQKNFQGGPMVKKIEKQQKSPKNSTIEPLSARPMEKKAKNSNKKHRK